MKGRTMLVLGAALAAVPTAVADTAVTRWDAVGANAENAAPDRPGMPSGRLHGVTVMKRQEDLVERPYFVFDGQSAYVSIPHQPALNIGTLTLSAWFKPTPGTAATQKPIAVKSRPTHAKPWYQYGLFIIDTAEHPEAISACLSVNQALLTVEGPETLRYDQWNYAALTFDGTALRLFVNGEWFGPARCDPGRIDAYPTALLIGAYENLPKARTYCFDGAISVLALADQALTRETVEAIYETELAHYPNVSADEHQVTAYERDLNAALRAGRDLWGEALIEAGGATYEALADRLRPLFYSTGRTNNELGVHNLLFGADGGAPPYIVPLADGSRIAENRYDSPRFLEFRVGPEGEETYGVTLADLTGPELDGGWYPILRTGYTDRTRTVYAQECFAAPLAGLAHQAAFVALHAQPPSAAEAPATVVIRTGKTGPEHLAVSPPLPFANGQIRWTPTPGASLFLIWSPRDPLPDAVTPGAGQHAAARDRCKRYWETRLERAAIFAVPEPLVLNASRNLLVQNLMLRWRYSLGSVVYHGAFYQPESSEAATTLGLFGYTQAARDSLAALLGMTKGPGAYVNWERGEKLSHGAHYYFLTRDAAFIHTHTPVYESYCADFARQIAADPNGLLRKERQCGDVPTPSYATFHQAVCWRGLRDMAEVWRQTGRLDLYEQFAPLADALRAAVRRAVTNTSDTLDDGTLFVGLRLLEPVDAYSPITETRLGSYWNLCMPYAFASGLWHERDPDLGRILDFMHGHGAVMLGLIRFNYYPTRIGSFRAAGLPGYYTTGFDNVYLPSYLQVLANRDEAERLILSFYGKLAHGMTRNTFVCGEGDSVGTRPSEFCRSSYGSLCSGNNVGFLLALRLLLVRETFADDSGRPDGLFLAHATPRPWLEHGKSIRVNDAPTCFGRVSYTIYSDLAEHRIRVELDAPERQPPGALRLRLRPPGTHTLTGVLLDGKPHRAFDPATETIDLSGCRGRSTIIVTYDGH